MMIFDIEKMMTRNDFSQMRWLALAFWTTCSPLDGVLSLLFRGCWLCLAEVLLSLCCRDLSLFFLSSSLSFLYRFRHVVLLSSTMMFQRYAATMFVAGELVEAVSWPPHG